MKKKVLIITYYWPPAGGIQVYRIVKFVKFLNQSGWEPIVYTAENPFYTFKDDFYLKEIPEETTVIKRRILEPLKLVSLLSKKKGKKSSNQAVLVHQKKEGWKEKMANWVRANFFIPDARSFWIKPSVSFLANYLKDNPVDLIFTTAPPHTTTVIGQKLKTKTGIPWVSDWRDPWTQVDYFKQFAFSKRAFALHRKLEQEAFRNANVITTVSSSWKNDLIEIGAKNVEVVYSGFDPEDMKLVNKQVKDEFTIVHAGTLSFDRFPHGLMEALEKLLSNSTFSSKLKLLFIGDVDYRIKELIKKSPLKNHVDYKGFISKKEVLEITANAQIVLTIINEASNMNGRIPGKIYEIMGLKKQTLCIGNEDSDIDKILKNTGLGECFSNSDSENIEKFILSVFNGKYNFEPNESEIQKFECKSQVKRLTEIFDQAIQK